MFLNCQMNVVHALYYLVLNDEKEQTIDTCKNPVESQRHYRKGKKSDPKGHILYDCVWVTFWKRDRKTDQWLPGAE